ncbi:hypothetical protein ACLBYG_22080 [Methylobacterium sp. D53M]
MADAVAARFDFIAIGPHGVYALCEDLPEDPRTSVKFIARIRVRGHRVERVPVAEAVERHRAFLALSGEARPPLCPKTGEQPNG